MIENGRNNTEEKINVFVSRFRLLSAITEEHLVAAQSLASNSEKIWSGGRIAFPAIKGGAAVIGNLQKAKKAHKVILGFDRIKRQLLDPSCVVAPALLILADNGSQRLYRNCEALVHKFPQLFPIRITVTPQVLAHELYGKEKDIKVLLVRGEDAITSFVTAVAAQCDKIPEL